jgi:hypothetical protein
MGTHTLDTHLNSRGTSIASELAMAAGRTRCRSNDNSRRLRNTMNVGATALSSPIGCTPNRVNSCSIHAIIATVPSTLCAQMCHDTVVVQCTHQFHIDAMNRRWPRPMKRTLLSHTNTVNVSLCVARSPLTCDYDRVCGSEPGLVEINAIN